MKIGFIGCGNMAKAIIAGIISSKITDSGNIYASDTNHEALNNFCKNNGICACLNNTSLVQTCESLVLCVKPQVFPEVLREIAPFLNTQLVISIAAGKSIEYIESFLGDQKIIRAMPNLNATISLSQTALCANPKCKNEDIAFAKKIFQSIGDTYTLEETSFSAFSACACCSPAFHYMYINALAKAAVACGLDEKTAFASAIGSVFGSAKMMQSVSDSPETLIERVCSPGGTTIEGVKKLRENHLETILEQAVRASFEKDKSL